MKIRYIFPVILYKTASSEIRRMIDSDAERVLKWNKNLSGAGNVKRLCACLEKAPFRSVFYYRMRKLTGMPKKLICKISKVFCPPCETVEILGDIGEGLLISHNFSVTGTNKAGRNLRVGPGVVIGRNSKGFPTIGNNVYVGSNSTVIGNITIGDNVIIGAGSVVVKDIPSNSVAVGNPAKVIRTLEERDMAEIM